MSRSLLKWVDEFLRREGPGSKGVLCRAIGRSERTLDRWLKNGVPTAHDVYKLAVTCGCSDEEALEISRECFPEAARETA
jgi:hypothetical protein